MLGDDDVFEAIAVDVADVETEAERVARSSLPSTIVPASNVAAVVAVEPRHVGVVVHEVEIAVEVGIEETHALVEASRQVAGVPATSVKVRSPLLMKQLRTDVDVEPAVVVEVEGLRALRAARGR